MSSKNEVDKGRLIIWRKIEDSWQWQKPLWRSAWIWMLMRAAYKDYNGLKRGQLYFSTAQGPGVWGMSRTETLRFLRMLSTPGPWNRNLPEILWEKSKGGRPLPKDLRQHGELGEVGGAVGGEVGGAVPGSVNGVITINNYNKYCPRKKQAGAVIGELGGELGGELLNCAPENQYILEKESINKGKEIKPPSDSGESGQISDHHAFIRFFTEQWESHFGSKYVFQGAKDASAAQRILKRLSLDEAKDRVIRFLDDDGPFVVSQGHTLAYLGGSINAYAPRKKTTKKDKWKEVFGDDTR